MKDLEEGLCYREPESIQEEPEDKIIQVANSKVKQTQATKDNAPTFAREEPFWSTKDGLRYRLNELRHTLHMSKIQASNFHSEKIYRMLEADAQRLEEMLSKYAVQNQESQEISVIDKVEPSTNEKLPFIVRLKTTLKPLNNREELNDKFANLIRTVNCMLEEGAPTDYVLDNGDNVKITYLKPDDIAPLFSSLRITLGDLMFDSIEIKKRRKSSYRDSDMVEEVYSIKNKSYLIKNGSPQFGVSIEDVKVWNGVFRSLVHQVYEKMQESQIEENKDIRKTLVDLADRYPK